MSTVTMQGLPGGPAENFVKEYLAHLHKLVGNDKLVINTLTELAHVNKAHARTIVHLIERRIKEVEKERHLPHIYLIDSICKNHGEPYIELFERNIIPTFCHIFKYADEKIRASLYKLRSTWSTSNMFERKLTDLDRTINANLDPAWPIRKSVPESVQQRGSGKILINPAKLKNVGIPKAVMNPGSNAEVRDALSPDKETERLKNEVLMKEKELLELKRKELELELATEKAKQKIREKTPTASSTNSSSKSSGSSSKSSDSKSAPQHDNQKGSSENRDPRRRRNNDSSSHKSSSSGSGSKSSSSSGSSSSHHRRSSDKSSPKKSSSSKSSEKKSSSSGGSSSHSKSSSSSSKRSSSRDKDPQRDSSRSSSGSAKKSGSSGSHHSSTKDTEERAKKREREEDNSPKFSRTPSPVPPSSDNNTDGGKSESLAVPPAAVSSNDGGGGKSPVDRKKSPSPKKANNADAGRISPLPRPPLNKIPKLSKKESEEKKKAEKRGHDGDAGNSVDGGEDKKESTSPPPDKRPKPLLVDVGNLVGDGDDKHLSPVVAGWAKHKETNPDQFRTPIKEEEPFFPDHQQNHHQHDHNNRRDGGRGGGRFHSRDGGFRNFRGGDGSRFRQDRGGGYGRGNFRRGGDRWGPRGGGGVGRWNDGGGYGGGYNRDGGGDRFGGGGGPPRGGGGPGMFGRGNNRGAGGGGGGQHFFPGGPGPQQPGDGQFSMNEIFNLDPTKVDPVYFENRVLPNVVTMAHNLLQRGEINRDQHTVLMSQITNLKQDMNRTREQNEQHLDSFDRHNNNNNQQNRRDYRRGSSDSDQSGQSSRTDNFNRRPHKNDLPLADPAVLEQIKADPTVTLDIDEVPRDIRWYGKVAVITQDDNKLYEISFKPERTTRVIIIDNSVEVPCYVGDPGWVEFRLAGNRRHRLRIGGPTRELFIDNDKGWNNFQFNSYKNINIGGTMHKIFIPGEPPQVDIGSVVRDDLCLGKVEVGIAQDAGQAEKKSKLFLDLKPQLLIIDRKPHVCQFVEDYSTLLINRHPFKTNFGGFPMVISVGGIKNFVRLYLPPEGVYVANIHPQNKPTPTIVARPPGPDPLASIEKSQGGVDATSRPPPLMASTPLPHSMDHPPPLIPPPQDTAAPAGQKEETEVPPTSTSPPVEDEAQQPPQQQQPDFNDLWAKLQNSGVFSMFSAPTAPAGGVTPSAAGGGTANGATGLIPGLDPTLAAFAMPPPPTSQQQQLQEPPLQQQQQPPQQGSGGSGRAARMRQNSVGMKEVTLKSHDPSLKERQQAIVDTLYGPNDLQCKSCGHRFTREEMNNYSSHLDWHFRAKRRERDNARKAQSRRWYYEKADWIVSDEIEDEELDLSEEEVILEQSLEVPTVRVAMAGGGANADSGEAAAGAGSEEETCPVCLEQFNVVFKQGEEEEEGEGAWHLHNAMRDSEGVAYHPECFKDKELQNTKWEDEESMDTSSATEILANIKKEDNTKDSGEDIVIDDDVQMKDGSATDADVKPKIEDAAVKVKQEEGVQAENTTEEGGKDTTNAENNEVKVKTEAATEDATVKTEVKTEGGESEALNESTASTTEDGATSATVKSEEGEDMGNKTLNLDSDQMQPTPVSMPKPKVDIKVSLTTAVKQEGGASSTASVDRQDSQSTDDETAGGSGGGPSVAFDKECIVVPAPSQEDKDRAKPKLRGKHLNVVPTPKNDHGISGLCSIM